ncbi:MAG: long-chain fatty acid--CoA ligase [Thermoleophilia bacterium]|nr:long-chain fatty acid--CoA ligase [Thermoleophilia bacterium]
MATEATPQAAAARVPSERARTIGRVWRDAVSAGRADPAYLVERDDGWRPVSWQDADRRVDELAHGLLALGLRKGDRLALLGATRLEWALVDLAANLVGVVVVPLYPTSSARDCGYILSHSGTKVAVVEDDVQRAKLESVREVAPLDHLLTFPDLDALAERGRAHREEHPQAVGEALAALSEEDVLMIVYTSGTTGPPKGCVLLQRNYVAVVDALDEMRELNQPGDVFLLFLPLAHSYAQLVLYAGAAIGYTVAFLPDMTRIADAAQAVRPTSMPSVPRVYEKVHAAVVAQFDAATGVKRRLIDWALAVGRRVSALRREDRAVPRGLAFQHRLADRLVYSKVKARLGGRLRYGISGAAPIAAQILEFFHALDILVLEGYGLTESSSGCSVNRPSRYRFGTVGRPLPGVEVRIDEDGEILIRGDNVFAGYYREEEATLAALTEDGWLRTGDVGELDPDGFLRITDRKKDILVTAGGKNVSPQNIETDLKTSKYVSQALVVGDRRPYVAALVTLDEPEVRRWAEERGLTGSSAELAASDDVRGLIQEVVDRANRERGRVEQVKRFRVLPRDFSQEDGELTPTMKVRRRVCEQHFAAEIEALYS